MPDKPLTEPTPNTANGEVPFTPTGSEQRTAGGHGDAPTGSEQRTATSGGQGGDGRGGGSDDDRYPYAAAAAVIIDVFQAENRKQREVYQGVPHTKGETYTRKTELDTAREREESAEKSHGAARSDDEHHAPLPRQWAIAGLVLLPEWYACYLGAEAFGQGQVLTALFATIMVVVLGGCEYWYDSAVRHRDKGQKKFALGMLAALILGLGGLRFYYGMLVENRHSILGALLLAVVLSIVTTALVAFGCFALYYSESIAAWKMRRAHKRAQRELKSAETAFERAKSAQHRAKWRVLELLEPKIAHDAAEKKVDPGKLREAIENYLDHLGMVGPKL